MIDSRELRQGNWVIYHNGPEDMPCQLDAQDIYNIATKYMANDEIHSPMPLSSDILLAVGFEKLKGTKDVYSILIDDTEISININLHYLYIDTDWGQASIKKPIFKYLHQVQNIIYSLTNKEIEYSPK